MVSVVPIMVKNIAIFLTIEMYVYIYKFNVFSETSTKFREAFFADEKRLKFILKYTSVSQGNCYKELLLCSSNFLSIAFSLTSLYTQFSLVTLVIVIRRLMATPIKLQWMLCMQLVDSQINKLKGLMKTTLEPSGANNAQNSDPPRYRNKIINVEKVDSVVHVYRMLAEKRNSLNRYYGFHLAFNICITVYSLILGTYNVWSAAVLNVDSQWNYFFMIKLLFFIIDVVIIASICESANKKVRY